MKKISKVLSVLAIISMLMTIVPLKVWATNDAYTITFNIDQNSQGYFDAGTNEQYSHNFQLDGSHLKIDGQYVEPYEYQNFTVVVTGNVATITINDATPVTLGYFAANKFSLAVGNTNINPDTVFSSNTTVLVKDYVQNAEPPENPEGPDNPGEGQGNTVANITITGGAGTYIETHYDPNLHTDVEEEIPYKKTYANARISINGNEIWMPFEEEVPDTMTVDGFRYNYDENDFAGTENEGKVEINFSSLFIKKYAGKIKINNIEYNVSDYLDYTDREAWLDHYARQCVSFSIFVPKADNYDIEVSLDDTDDNTCFIGNFLWTGDPAQEYILTPEGDYIIDEQTGEKRRSDNFIGHSKLKLVKVEYEKAGQNVVRDFTDNDQLEQMDLGEREVGPGTYYHDYSDGVLEYGYVTKLNGNDVTFDDGELVVPDGAMVTMKIVPEYGYQVTSFGINDENIITGDNISEFSFEIGKGNFHLGAQVEAVENLVKIDSGAVESGSVQLSDGEFDSGSARLSVIESDPSEEKKNEFEENLGEGYSISNYLNISLDQVFYKGSEENVWAIEKEQLDNDATITLKLEDSIDPENTILVHNVHDGEEFEEVEFEYDAETKTVTFTTNSFSNYAFATKQTDEVYTIDLDDFIVVFTDKSGHQFVLSIKDVYNMTDDELEEAGISKEVYEEAMAKLEKSIKKYGKVLGIYEIIIDDATTTHTGETLLKIKMTDEMKKYNSFKFVNIDENTLEAGEVVEAYVEGDYLVVKLPHLSIYALVGENVDKVSNPETGDNISNFMALFIIAGFGVLVSKRLSKKRRLFNK